jgi:hypothetical protein
MCASRRRARAAVLVFAIGAAGPGARAEDVVTEPTAAWVAPERAPDWVRERCGIDAEIPSWLASHVPGLRLDTDMGKRHLTLRIEAVHAPAGGVWSGPKWIELTGTLAESGRTVGSFRARRASFGGPLAPFIDTCGILSRAARALGRDVADWLEDPRPDARLGDAQRAP